MVAVLAKPSLLARAARLPQSVVRGLFKHHAFDHAATMAFYFFLGTIPLLVFAGLLVGNIVEREGAEELSRPLYRAMPKVASDFMRTELTRIGGASPITAAPLSMLGFLWLTTNGVHNLMDVFELLVHARPRPWWKQRLIAVVWVVAGLGGIAAVTWLVLFVNGAASGFSARHLPALLHRLGDFVAQGWQRVGVLVVFVAMVAIGLALFYRTAVVHPPGIRRHVWTGTAVALLLWGIVSWGFGAYVMTIAHYAIYYGSLATVAVILLWLYLTSLALLVGAEVNAHIEGMRDASGAAIIHDDVELPISRRSLM
ncbi:MAG: Inner rane protein YihY, formerly thought to be RNase [Labilithrix sp.]|nr:Inner rane protein YihY, formerly thought to be RNase [Labilithrix sp.]